LIWYSHLKTTNACPSDSLCTFTKSQSEGSFSERDFRSIIIWSTKYDNLDERKWSTKAKTSKQTKQLTASNSHAPCHTCFLQTIKQKKKIFFFKQAYESPSIFSEPSSFSGPKIALFNPTLENVVKKKHTKIVLKQKNLIDENEELGNERRSFQSFSQTTR
jgi:hypothetical protein